jgi:16S rRNA G966 N2-methylase RsmD
MPHAYNVACNGFKTPLQAFYDDDIFKKVIDKRIKMGDNISDNGIRKMLKIYTGVQCVSNFRPTSACAIYNLFGKNKVVWDMSCGYGGRLLGAYKAGVKKYIGTEPCTDTFNGLNNIIEFINNINQNNLTPYSNTEFELYKLGSEEFIPNEEVDLCFTSPPYFNTEKYSDEDTQSWKKYETKELWLNNFLGKTLDNCMQCLKKDAILIVNIANVKSYKNIEDDFLMIAKEKGFKLIDIMKYNLSSLSHNSKFKFEPVFIFKK